MNANIRILLVIGIVSLLAGCKLATIVTTGGDVFSLSDIHNCYGGKVCEIEVTDTTFSESFTAIPRAGYAFSHWAKGDFFLCANSTEPTCTVSNVNMAGNTPAEAVIASDKMYYIMPVFVGNGENIAKLEVRVTSGPVMTNSRNEILGRRALLNQSTNVEYAQIYIEGYPLQFWLFEIGEGWSYRIDYESTNCTGKPLMARDAQTVVSRDFRVYIQDTNAVPFLATRRSYWNWSGVPKCTRVSTPSESTYYQAVLTDIQLPDGRLYAREL
ncbi:Uncharacterised protein [Halioglobus japonicus]|nr:Uncharacterised protein [Halioglobus japonicus]